MYRIALLVEIPLRPNIKKQLNAFVNLFPDYKIDLITAKGVYNLADLDSIDIQSKSKIRDWVMNTILLFFILSRYMKNTQPNLVMNMSDWLRVAPIAAILCKIFHIPLVIRIAGSRTFKRYEYANLLKKLPMFFLSSIIGKITLKSVNKLIVMGPYEKKRLLDDGFTEDMIKVIPPAVVDRSASKAQIEKRNLKKELGFSPNSKIVLFVGRVTRLKGADNLKKIAEEVSKYRNNIIFCIVGEGEYKDELNKLRNVKTTGFKKSSEVISYYKAADLFILPSKAEGLPNVILEALVYKLPVVTSNVGELPWIVSKTCNEWIDFVDYIINGKWRLDVLPNIFQEKEYKNRFAKILEETRE